MLCLNDQCQMQEATCSSYHQTYTPIPFLEHTITNFTLNTCVPWLTSLYVLHQSDHSVTSLQTNLVQIKGFVLKVLSQLHRSWSINEQCQMQQATCYSYHQTHTSIPYHCQLRKGHLQQQNPCLSSHFVFNI